jgi:PIN domain nuclease of toxin-antitoxin system
MLLFDREIANASAVHVSAVSLWEMGIKVSAGKLKLPVSMETCKQGLKPLMQCRSR